MTSDNLDSIRFIDILIFLVLFMIMYYLITSSIISRTPINDTLILEDAVIPIDDSYITTKISDQKKRSRHLKIRYVYTCSLQKFDTIKKLDQGDKIHHLFYFRKVVNKKDSVYVCFYTSDKVVLFVPPKLMLNIKTYPYKMYDTYVMGDTRIFSSIQDILMNQGFDRDLFGENCISTTYLNEICSNKLEYIRYFMKHGLMVETVIKPYSEKDVKNTYPGRYVKTPYSSRSVCAFYEKISPDCFAKDGLIVQEKNYVLSKYEFKCYVVDGEITMTVVRLNGNNSNICIPGDTSLEKTNGVPIEIIKLMDRYKHELRSTAKDAFYHINALIHMRLQKLEEDEKIIKEILSILNLNQRDSLRVRYILNGLVNSEKIDLINKLNKKYKTNLKHDLLTKSILEYPDPFDDELNTDCENKIKIYDRFMRVDMALPDDKKYTKITVTEIEPFASGIYMYRTVGPCMINDDLNTFDNITAYNLYKIISTEK